MKFYKTLITLSLIILTANAFAHTGLSSSVPADNAMLMESPQSIDLKFTADVHLTKLEVVSKMGGNPVEIGFTPSAAAGSEFSAPLPELAMGHYQVSWGLLGGDGHQIEGSFEFMVHSEGMPMMEHSEVSMPMMNHGTDGMPMMDHSGMTMPMATDGEEVPTENHENHNGH